MSVKKTKEESLRDLRKQYKDAKEKDDTKMMRMLEKIFTRLDELPQVSELAKALKKHSKNRD
jgi:hypothetical protein